MNFSQKLLTELKAAQGLPSDYKAAQILNVSKQGISNIKTGRQQFCDETIVKIAQLLELDPVELVAQKHLEAEESPIMRQFWGRILETSHLAAIQQPRDLQADQVA